MKWVSLIKIGITLSFIVLTNIESQRWPIQIKLKEQFNAVDSKFPALCYLPFVSRKARKCTQRKITT
jgi:hypothetical protein